MKKSRALLEFDGPCGTEITGVAGEEQTLTLYAQVTTFDMSAGIEGGAIAEMTLDDTAAAAYVSADNGFAVHQAATGPDKEGIISAVVPSLAESVILPENTTHTLLKVSVSALFPLGGTEELRLSFADDMQGEGQPVKSLLVVERKPFPAELKDCVIKRDQRGGRYGANW